jgi:hypothetical protein
MKTNSRASLDGAVCLLLFLGSLAYLRAWPHDFYWYDEGLFLYEAKRILAGDVIYRDFFEIVTPATWYLMASLFRVFGVDIETARTAMAALHGVICVSMYASCRALGIARSLAVAAAVAHIALSYPALPNASPHWFSTFITVVLLLIFVRRPWRDGAARAALLPGLVVGTLIAVQQQKGVVMAGGGMLLLWVDSLLDRRFGATSSPVAHRFFWYAAGVAAVVLPLLLTLIAAAGLQPVYAALVEFPLFHYQDYNRVPWGYYLPEHPELYVRPLLRKYLPLVVLVAAARIPWELERGDERRARGVTTQVVLAAIAILSISYRPDYTHLAFVSPLVYILTADTVQWIVGWIPRPRPARVVGLVTGLCLIASVAAQAGVNLERRRMKYSTPIDTEFGRIDFAGGPEPALVEKLGELLQETNREIFCYPACAGLYLMTGTTNATRYQILIPGYNTPEQIDEALGVLESRRVPYVVVIPTLVKWKEDPVVKYVVAKYVRKHYRRNDRGRRGVAFTAPALFERKARSAMSDE